jgi:hypothetical protein
MREKACDQPYRFANVDFLTCLESRLPSLE